MTIVYRVVDLQDENTGTGPDLFAYVRISGPESIANFQELVRRALNCWDRAPVELKEFGDMVTEGKLLQDYAAQEGQLGTKQQP